GEFTPVTSGQPGVAPTIVSLRAKKSRDRLTLTSIPGAMHACSFTPAGSKRVARSRRTPPAAPTAAEAAKPAPVAEPVAAPATPAEPTAAPVTPAEPGAEAGPMPP